MIRVAFPLIGGRRWTGGYNYLCNLLRVLGDRAVGRVSPFLFLGTDLPEEDIRPFLDLPHLAIVRHSDFDEALRSRRLKSAILTGEDCVAAAHFREHGMHVVFEPAQFYGWRFPFPAIAWIPDFQHRHLKHLFGPAEYWRRELGFRAQVWSRRQIMLSSEDARRDCESFYPASLGHTAVVRFAVPAHPVDRSVAKTIAEGYGLPDRFFLLPNQFWKHKNHECVIRALHLLKERGESIVIAVTGKQEDPRDPEHFHRLTKMVEAWNLRDQFRLLGLVPYGHLSALLHACVALINPSRFEGWSTTVEEAKSAGVPMLLSSLAVHKEQAEARATFFDPDSPEQLAAALSAFSPWTDTVRRMAIEVAAKDAEQRITRFADEFSTLVERSAALPSIEQFVAR